MDGIKMQPECITPTLWQNVQTLVRATKYHLKGVPWVKASQLYVCIEPGFFAICSLYNIYQSRPTNTLRAYWMDGQWLNVCLFRDSKEFCNYLFWKVLYQILNFNQNKHACWIRNDSTKGGFSLESAICFSDLQISKKKYSKNLSWA